MGPERQRRGCRGRLLFMSRLPCFEPHRVVRGRRVAAGEINSKVVSKPGARIGMMKAAFAIRFPLALL